MKYLLAVLFFIALAVSVLSADIHITGKQQQENLKARTLFKLRGVMDATPTPDPAQSGHNHVGPNLAVPAQDE
jgi:hypothetical protein